MDYVILTINGGIGKNIMATAVVKALRKKRYKKTKIVILSSWPQVWLNNPCIFRVYNTNVVPYFYDDFIKGKDVKILSSEPYMSEDFIQKNSHCVEAWCKMLDVKHEEEGPEIFLTTREMEIAKNKFQTQKPLLLLQTSGGIHNPDNPVSWVRDFPLGQASKIIEILKDNYEILHIKQDGQPEINGVQFVTFSNIRELFALVWRADKFLVIDSCVQHACAAFGKRATVVWPIDNTKTLGYELHDNIIANTDHRETHSINALFGEFHIDGWPHECPFKTDDIFDVPKIVESLMDDYKPVEAK